MFIVLAILAGVILLAKNTHNPNPPKSSTDVTTKPSLISSAPDWYASTGTDTTDNPPNSSAMFTSAAIGKPPTSNAPVSVPDIQIARYHNDAAQIAPNPLPNPSFEHTVPILASRLYQSSFENRTVTPRWLE